MADPVEVLIESALLARAQAFATAQAVTIALPNVAFDSPPAKTVAGGSTVYGKWLRATFLPAPSFETGVSFNSHVQHYGLLQLDVMYGQGAGEPAVARIAAAAIQFFPRGRRLAKDGVSVLINSAPRRASMLKDDPWMQIPVSIPYLCFARPA
jgi:hypothetical protein